MGWTSEQVHWAFGAALVAVGIVLLARAYDVIRARWPDFVIPAALLAFALALILDPLIHGSAAPADYAAETGQHLALGLVLVTASALELYRVAKQRDAWLWRSPLALALAAAASVFLVHAQHESDAPMLLLVTQHRIIGATLLVLAFGVLLPTGTATTGARPVAVPLLTLLLGFELLIYTEGSSLFGVPMAGEAGHAPAEHNFP